MQPNEMEHRYHRCEQSSHIVVQNCTIGTLKKQSEVTGTKKKSNSKSSGLEGICAHVSLTFSSSSLTATNARPAGREIHVSSQLLLVHRCFQVVKLLRIY